MDPSSAEYSALLRILASTKFDPMPETRRTGFFDLPAELRLMIYGHILPADRKMRFPANQWHPELKTVIALCATHPQISQELEELIYK